MQVITNNVPRTTLCWADLTTAERADLDYLQGREDDVTLVRYRGAVYDLGEFMRAPDDMKPWDGVATDSFFSATLVRYADSTGESVIMGRCYS